VFGPSDSKPDSALPSGLNGIVLIVLVTSLPTEIWRSPPGHERRIDASDGQT